MNPLDLDIDLALAGLLAWAVGWVVARVARRRR